MTLENLAITKTNDLPIRHEGNVHDGKVRSVYWLTQKDNARLRQKFSLTPESELGVMVISDRISAFECKWQTKSGLKGVPGKGASLNAISKYWFDCFEEADLAPNHVLATPHPLVWIVEKAQPILVEAIARQHITGSMWRDYEDGTREFGGVMMPEGLKKDQRLDQLLITPSTKGIITGIPGIPEQDDVNITRQQILDNYKRFGFKSRADVALYERLLTEGFELIANKLDLMQKIFVDTKFEFGYVRNGEGEPMMIYMDEIGTPDSSRYWDKIQYQQGKTVEESKEAFRQELLNNVPDRDVLLNKKRMAERVELAKTYRVPDSVFMNTSALYKGLAQQITGRALPEIRDARGEIIESLKPYGIIEEAA
jgi:phosphoribosylaminoimidazole-succinocarboxamide synthase